LIEPATSSCHTAPAHPRDTCHLVVVASVTSRVHPVYESMLALPQRSPIVFHFTPAYNHQEVQTTAAPPLYPPASSKTTQENTALVCPLPRQHVRASVQARPGLSVL
jgi:hypothetical protein